MVAKEQAQRSDCLGSSPDPTICLLLVNLRPVAFIFLDLRFLIKKGKKKTLPPRVFMKIKWGKMYEALSMVPGTLGELRDS